MQLLLRPGAERLLRCHRAGETDGISEKLTQGKPERQTGSCPGRLGQDEGISGTFLFPSSTQ